MAVNDSSLHNPSGPVTLNVTNNDTDPNVDLLVSTVDLDPTTAGIQTTKTVAGQGASPEAIAQVAAEAERLELDSVWSWERLMRPTVPIPMGGPGGPVMDAPDDFGCVYDPIETLSYVAALFTTTIEP